MASVSVDTTGKRKRSPPPPQQQRLQPGLPQINYAPATKKLKLIEGDSETFKDLLGMIDDYEAVLQRHESLAANLGAKLVGPLLLKSLDKIFDGEIRTTRSSFALEQTPATWLDLVNLARSSPGDFMLSDSVATIYIRGGQVEISEDDYRLIMSGAPERMIPNQPIPEDEAAELGTLNILESRLSVLIKKADVVASKARQLNYHIGKHKTAVQSRLSNETTNGNSMAPSIAYSHHAQSPSPMSHSPAPVNDPTKLQQDLLKQFIVDGGRPSSPAVSKPRSDARRSLSNIPPDYREPPASHPDDYRSLMTAKVEKIFRGDPIDPPCDRCRRLKFDCTKNLTACTACTKKHAKCSWVDITDDELASIQGSGGGNTAPAEATENLDPRLATAHGVITVRPHYE
ncbi:C6 finger domain-containing protein [Phlyctema vagabunda]|uniref:C6 finger domain-containing protein n=1 Tax=Phlyctema vagabunda TaxID=108571 RepID=A0ABR4PHG7_9HELO